MLLLPMRSDDALRLLDWYLAFCRNPRREAVVHGALRYECNTVSYRGWPGEPERSDLDWLNERSLATTNTPLDRAPIEDSAGGQRCWSACRFAYQLQLDVALADLECAVASLVRADLMSLEPDLTPALFAPGTVMPDRTLWWWSGDDTCRIAWSYRARGSESRALVPEGQWAIARQQVAAIVAVAADHARFYADLAGITSADGDGLRGAAAPGSTQ
jgi:hypothetical protein